jgi:hypothetical protein
MKMTRRPLAVILPMWICVVILINIPSQASGQTIQSPLLDQILEQDNSALLDPSNPLLKSEGGFRASFMEIKQPVSNFTYGVTVNLGEAAWSSDWCVLKVTSSLERGPVYRQPDAGHERDPSYDSSGRFMIAHTAEQYFICNKDRSDRIDVVRRYGVDSRGVVSTNEVPWLQLNQFPPGDRNSIYLFWQFIQATGRGFARHLATITSEKAYAGMVQAEAKGSIGAGLMGQWVLACEKGSDPLVRSAAFFAESDSSHPYMEISNSGRVECRGLWLAQSGDLRIGPLKTHFEVLDLKPLKSPDPHECRLYREVLKRLQAPLPQGSQVIDRRGKKLKVMDVE